ncbi:MAG TPA: DUF6174 domain-containing protein, partial [Gemmatimonadaceae bacterium]|nr:DUF6174 domain-containing protein [Gemmatimonadaceae bacterium]
MRLASLTFACLAAAAVTVGACDGPTAPERKLQAARLKWEHTRPAAYTYTVALYCFCPQEGSGPVIVSVRDGVVESRTYVNSGAAVAPTYADYFPTIDGLFEVIEDARRQGAYAINVTYDPARGFPVVISIDYERATADDELTYRATNI